MGLDVMSSVSVGSGGTWQSTTSVGISGILDAANDGPETVLILSSCKLTAAHGHR